MAKAVKIKKFRPMLAVDCDAEIGKAPEGIVYPVLCSPKFDGLRAVRFNGHLVSRTLKLIPSEQAQRITAHLRDGVDGELIVGDPWNDPFRRTSSAVRSRNKEVPDLRFHTFDDFMNPGGFYDRHMSLPASTELVQVIPHTFVRNAEELLAMEKEFLDKGYEGLMGRSVDGPYKYGRSTLAEGWLWKLKRFRDSEAIVLDTYEREHNANEAETNDLGLTQRSTNKENMEPTGLLGGFVVRDVNKESEFYGMQFKCSTSTIPLVELGPMWEQRKSYEGKILVYKYFPTGSKEKPRHPVFKWWRPLVELA